MFKGILFLPVLLVATMANGALLTDFSKSFALYQATTRQPTDFDDDGTVAGADILRFQRGSGMTGQTTKALGDANRDGRVDKIDLNLLMGQFGSSGVPNAAAFKLYFDPPGVVLGTVTAFVDAPDPGGGQQRFTIGAGNGISEKHPDYSANIVSSVLSQPPGRQRIESKIQFSANNQTSPPIGEITIFGVQILDNLPQLGNANVQVGFEFEAGDSITVFDTDTGQTTTFQENQLQDVAPPLALPLALDISPAGATRIRNPNNFPVALSYYEILSPAGALDPVNWTSIQDSGVPGWQEAGGISPNALAESNLTGALVLPAAGVQLLGTAFNPAGLKQLEFNYVGLASLMVTGDVNFDVTALPVPEPGFAALAVWGSGLLGLWNLIRSRRGLRGILPL